MIRLTYFVLTCLLVASGYRLPRDVIPEHYKLEIISYLGVKDNFDFDGKVWIQTTCLRPTQNITLHSKNLDLKEKEVTVKDISSNDPKTVKTSCVELVKENDFLVIRLEETLKEDHKYEIFIAFKGKMDDGLAGFYRSSYLDKKKKEKRWLGVTQFEAISARMAFPCFDEPDMKATFDISIGRKDGYRAISNMPLLQTEPLKEKEGWFWDRFDSSVPMSTYLVAYIVSDFEYKTGVPIENNNVTFRIWARKDALDQVDFAKEVGPKALDYYEKFFDVKYPLPKQDMVAIPDFSAGAMENWGLITYREAYLLYDPKVSSKMSQHNVASVIAHELAHQWFGNLVTMKWWTDLWLNEGFATFMASLAVDKLFPQWNSLQEEAASNMISVFSFDSLRTSHPVSVPIGDPKEIEEIFDTISYKKGSSLIRMMTLFLGEEVVRKGVSNYLKKHKFSNAEQDDLWESLTEEAHKNSIIPKTLTVKTIMDTWTLQTGYPVITVNRNYKKKTAEISQRRYLRDILSPKDNANSCWWIPLSYSTKQRLDFNRTTPDHWLSCPIQTQVIQDIAGENDWIIFNNQMAGIYKINYDDENWKLIIKTLQSDEYVTIPTLNRVQLISDSADLAFIGNLKYDIFFDLVNYLKADDEYLPWKAALGKTSGLATHLQKSEMYGLFKEYMQKLLSPIYEKLGLEIPAASADKLDSIKLRVLIASKACKFEVANCITHSQNLFREFTKNPNTTDLAVRESRNSVAIEKLQNSALSFAASVQTVDEVNRLLNTMDDAKNERVREKLAGVSETNKDKFVTVFHKFENNSRGNSTLSNDTAALASSEGRPLSKAAQVLLATAIVNILVMVLLVNIQYPFCQFKDYFKIPKDLRGVVYCTTLKHGGEEEWEFLWNHYKNSNVATEKNTILSALGCTKQVPLLTRYLEWSLDDTIIRRQDSSSVFSSVARNDVGYELAKNFFYDRVDQIFKHLQPNKRRISRFLSSIANQMIDPKEQKELEQFIEKNKQNFSDVKKGVEQSLETVKINVQWQKTHAEAIHRILTKYSTAA